MKTMLIQFGHSGQGQDAKQFTQTAAPLKRRCCWCATTGHEDYPSNKKKCRMNCQPAKIQDGCFYCAMTGFEDYPTSKVPCRRRPYHEHISSNDSTY